MLPTYFLPLARFKATGGLKIMAVGNVDAWLALRYRADASLIVLSTMGRGPSAETDRDIARLIQVASIERGCEQLTLDG